MDLFALTGPVSKGTMSSGAWLPTNHKMQHVEELADPDMI